MCDTTFAFSQRGGVFFDSPSQWQMLSLPPRLDGLFTNKKIASIHSLTLGLGNSFFVSYKGTDGLTHIEAQDLPTDLHDFLFVGRQKRCFEKLRVSLGPYNDSWYATDDENHKWKNLPDDLERSIIKFQSEDDAERPRLVSLGAFDNYLMITKNHGSSWVLNHYPELRDLIKALGNDAGVLSVIKNLVLHPYRLRCCILQAENGTTLAKNLSPHMEKSFELIHTAVKEDTVAQERKLKLELAELELSVAREQQQAEQVALLRRIEEINQINRINEIRQINQNNQLNQIRQYNQVRQMEAINEMYTMSAISSMFSSFVFNNF